MKTRTEFRNVIIIGGGLAGLTLACLLGKAGVNVRCVERMESSGAQGDLRTTAISYGSMKILEEAGVWKHLIGKTCPINNIEILDGNSPVLLNFLSAEVEDKSFGWIVLNSDLKVALINVFQSYPSLTYMPGRSLKSYEASDDGVICNLDDGTNLSACLLVGADGRGSAVRKMMGVRTRQWSYRQQAVICTVSHENSHNNIAVEHFWPQGPFAILPMADDKDGRHRSSVVFTQHGAGSISLMDLDDKMFELALAQKFPGRYGDIKLIGRRAIYPLGLVHAAEYIKPRAVLVADAAHGIHPIAGQGLNLGFRDVAELASLIVQEQAIGGDIGAKHVLETYQRRRRSDNMAMVAVTDGLNRLFSNNAGPVRFLRRAGLRIVSKIGPAKRFFMSRAMGDH